MAVNIDICKINVINKTNNMKMETTIKIIPPEGCEVDKEKSTFSEIVFKKIEPNLPMSWEELKEVKGYFINQNSDININPMIDKAVAYNRNVFPTNEEAKAMLAMAQLCQLRDRWNGGWKANWKDDTVKYCITSIKDILYKDSYCNTHHPMAFKTKELRDDFMVVFKDLLETAKPFL